MGRKQTKRPCILNLISNPMIIANNYEAYIGILQQVGHPNSTLQHHNHTLVPRS